MKKTKRLASILLALVMLFALVPAMSGTAYAESTTVTWNDGDITGSGFGSSFSKDGVTITCRDFIDFMDKNFFGGGTITTTLGNFTKIEVSARDVYHLSGTGWSNSPGKATWTGNATSVSFSGDIVGLGRGVTFVFTIETPNVDVTGVTLDKESATLTVGGTETLTATVSPDDATDKSVTWASDDESVATVADGVVTAVAAGTANITVTSNADSTKSASCAVTVNDPTAAATAEGYTGAYDGNSHGITVTVTKPESGATVKYGMVEGTYDLNESPTITDVAYSPLTVYYQVTADGYDATTGSATVTISKADQTHPAAPTAESVTATSVTLVAIENGEYKCGDGEWQQSPTFTGLTKHSEYTFYQRLAGDANHNASLTSPAAVIRTSSHVHNWSYEASGATITATCGNTDGGHDGSTTATLTIAAPEHSVFGDGKSAEATITGSIDGVDTPAIEYVKLNETLTAAPTDAGEYVAQITLGEATAHVDYTVAKADITPTVSIDGWTYGETAKTPSITGNTANGAVTYTYAVKGSTDFSATVPANAGDYTVKATVAATNNYNGGEATADFTIAKATVTVTAEAKSKTYGEADPALTYTSSGLVGSDALTGALTRETGENAGTYAIGQGTLTAGDNYTISYTGANFTINKAAITITADDKSSKYDDDLVELTYTVGGAYKAGDELGVTLNTTATKTSDVGEYPITVSWNENANYTATVTSGKYTITKTGLTVTAAGYTGTYDGAAHGISVDVGSSGAAVYYAGTELTAGNYTTAGSTTNPTYTDAGEYTVYFYVVSGNYDPDTISGSKTVSINKATMTKNELTAAQKPTAKTDLIADNTDQVLLTAPEALPEGYTKIQYSIDNGTTWTDEIPTGKDPGDTTVLTKYVGDKNHADFEGEAVTATIKTLTVTFEVNGGSAVAAQNVIKGEKATKPDDPTKAGNAFDGWFQDATFSVAFDFAAPVTDDVTLYAKWTPNDYTLTSITGTSTDISHTWVKDSSVSVVITAKLTTEPDDSFAHFIGVQLDGTTLVRDTDYTAKEGSTIVTLASATLQKLSVGAHTVTILYDNGRVDARLTVLQPSSSPKTGDESHAALWLAVLAVSGVGMAATLLGAKKRRTAMR